MSRSRRRGRSPSRRLISSCTSGSITRPLGKGGPCRRPAPGWIARGGFCGSLDMKTRPSAAEARPVETGSQPWPSSTLGWTRSRAASAADDRGAGSRSLARLRLLNLRAGGPCLDHLDRVLAVALILVALAGGGDDLTIA